MWLKPKKFSKASIEIAVIKQPQQQEKKKRGKKKPRTNYRMNQSVRMIINVFLGSQLSVSFPPLGATAHLRLPRRPSNTVAAGLWTCCKDSSGSNLVLLLHVLISCSQLPELGLFLLCEYSLSFYVVRRHRVYLLDRVDLICSFCSWWEGFRSS